MPTLVTGATGFLGSHVARQLVARGEAVRVLVRLTSRLRAIEDLPVERATGDLRDLASLYRACDGVHRVYHVAADYRFGVRRPSEIYESNVDRKSTRLNSCHLVISYAVFCLKKKKTKTHHIA